MTIYVLIETEKNMFLASHFNRKKEKKKITHTPSHANPQSSIQYLPQLDQMDLFPNSSVDIPLGHYLSQHPGLDRPSILAQPALSMWIFNGKECVTHDTVIWDIRSWIQSLRHF